MSAAAQRQGEGKVEEAKNQDCNFRGIFRRFPIFLFFFTLLLLGPEKLLQFFPHSYQRAVFVVIRRTVTRKFELDSIVTKFIFRPRCHKYKRENRLCWSYCGQM